MARYDSGLLDLTEACEYLKVSRTTIFRLRDAKAFPFLKIGNRLFFRREDLDTYIRNHTAFAA
ncbi:helix-turn-helix domain-containing protein [Corynebacterium phoceense]|uniref:helix-turn-helix domain-containing protein n=1 Tax=Corynebacterium phoceense TaxID=1686286 RepID=UPI0018AA5A3A|nr:helix-turn-helix domain-containing protein [Corynebacterium phoceense]MBF9011341.1 helix-turn-helix domain-containing protein [Corynebacterium phoceense]